MRTGAFAAAASIAAAILCSPPAIARQERPTGQGFSFRSAVDLINVTVTVTDQQGRFVPNLTRDDFELYEEGTRQTISQFDAERVPVSLGIALDTSGSMLGEKIAAAQAALNRFLFELLGPNDEVFLYRFDSSPDLVQGWTEDRGELARALGSVKPNGGTAMYDTVAEAIPLAQGGSRRKKALVIISDGNDRSSRTRVAQLRSLIRESEVLVYAIGIDASGSDDDPRPRSTASSSARPSAVPRPSPFPGVKPPPARTTSSSSSSSSRPRPGNRTTSPSSIDRVNPDALRELTDDSGGRTEIIVSPRDLDPATAGIADELSRQYFLGYQSTLPKDGRWHTIEVRVKKSGNFIVRARRGFIAN